VKGVGIFPLFSRLSLSDYSNSADLVLIAMYCSAFLSILSLVIDWVRPRVFSQGHWQTNSMKALSISLGIVIVTVFCAVSFGWFIAPSAQYSSLVSPQV